MNQEKLFQFLKEEKIFYLVEENYKHFINVFKNSLTISNEDVLIITDLGYPKRRIPAIMAGCYVMAAKELSLNFKISMQKPKHRGEEADDNIIHDMLFLKDKSVIVVCISNKIGSMKKIGRSFRKYIRQHHHRFVSTPGLYDLPTSMFRYLIRSIGVDYSHMAEKGEKLKKIIDEGSEVHMITRRGTDICYNVEGMKAISNDGIYKKNGFGGNIPAGEVYVPCNGKNVNGKIVVDGSMKVKEKTILLKKPVTLYIENGEVVKIKGNGDAEKLEKVLKWAYKYSKYTWGVRRIGELGIGINPDAKIMGPTIINEKTLGTAHFAIGSNAWFGGSIYAKIHLDQVLTEPMIKVDGKLLNGVLMKV